MSPILALYSRSPHSVHGFIQEERQRRALVEDGMQSFQTIVGAALTFFEEKQRDVVDLPASSSERATIETAMGLLTVAKATVDKGSLPNAAETLRAGMQGVIAEYDAESDLYLTVRELLTGLQDFIIMSTDEEDDVVPDSEPDSDALPPPPPTDEEDDVLPDDALPDEEEKEDTTSSQALGKALGLL